MTVKTDVQKKKAFSHNMRNLFARMNYEKYRDVKWLADILGHISVITTRICTMKNLCEQAKQMNRSLLLCGYTTDIQHN